MTAVLADESSSAWASASASISASAERTVAVRGLRARVEVHVFIYGELLLRFVLKNAFELGDAVLCAARKGGKTGSESCERRNRPDFLRARSWVSVSHRHYRPSFLQIDWVAIVHYCEMLLA